jgi:co-chaperonin GroES (HSP10)
VAVGPGRTTEAGVVLPMSVSVGDRVLVSNEASGKNTIKLDDGTLGVIIRDGDIEAIIEE